MPFFFYNEVDSSDPRYRAYARLIRAIVILSTTIFLGTTLFHTIGGGRWAFFDCFYMTVITVSTVGFGESLPGMEAMPEARIVTMALIAVGSLTLLYFLSTFTAFIIEGDLQGIIKQRRMQSRIDQLRDHIIVCGAGNTGEHVIAELVRDGHPFVVIEMDEERIQTLASDLGAEILYVIGDATDDHHLLAAGIKRASGVIAALHTDKDNLFVVVSANALAENGESSEGSLRIVTKAIDSSARGKLERAGATSIVSPNEIGGLRLVSELIRPTAVEFLDRLLRTDRSLRVEDVAIPPESNLVGKTLAQASIRETGALVIAVRQPDGEFAYNPAGTLQLVAGASLIVIAHMEDVLRLRDGIRDDKLLVT
ncbi:MAG: potassium channel protein [Myxococcota bacterium]